MKVRAISQCVSLGGTGPPPFPPAGAAGAPPSLLLPPLSGVAPSPPLLAASTVGAPNTSSASLLSSCSAPSVKPNLLAANPYRNSFPMLLSVKLFHRSSSQPMPRSAVVSPLSPWHTVCRHAHGHTMFVKKTLSSAHAAHVARSTVMN